MIKKRNYIESKGEYAIIHIENSLKGHLECLIDLDDIDKIKNYYWNIRYDKRHPNCTIYVETHKRINGKSTRIHLHRLIMNCPSDMVIDHINHNGLDNRKINLRITTQKINSVNRITNHGKYMQGVSFDNRHKYKKFYSYFREKFLGSFETEIEAHNAYLKERENYLSFHLQSL